MLHHLILLVLICKGPIPEKIFMRSGRWLPNQQPINLHLGMLIYERHGIAYRLPPHSIDWARTLKRKPKPKPRAPRPHEIPWNHPTFARKTKTSKPVALSDVGLAEFVKLHPYVVNESVRPADEELEAVDPSTELLKPERSTRAKATKPEKAKKVKRSKRKKKEPKEEPPERILAEPLWSDDSQSPEDALREAPEADAEDEMER